MSESVKALLPWIPDKNLKVSANKQLVTMASKMAAMAGLMPECIGSYHVLRVCLQRSILLFLTTPGYFSKATYHASSKSRVVN